MAKLTILQLIYSVTIIGVKIDLSPALSNPCLHVGSFNVKWFNLQKSENPDVMNTLADVIQRYDIMLMMEIRDDNRQTAMTSLWELVNQTTPYGLTLSKPLGKNPRRYAEQYGFFYREGKAQVVDTFQYDDSLNDGFEREPYAVLIKPSQISSHPGTALIGVHIQPKNAVSEMGLMVEVTDSILRHWNTDKAVIIGDLNADCSFMSATDLAETPLRTDHRFKWLIPDTADTTILGRTDCAYDRIIITENVAYRSPAVFNFRTEYSLTFQEASAVSDHFPVEALIC